MLNPVLRSWLRAAERAAAPGPLDDEVLVVRAAPVPAPDVLHLLDDDTRARLTGTRRDATASAHALLRLVLSELTGQAPAAHRFTRRCLTCGGPHGKPVLAGSSLHTSLSTTRTLVVVAVTGAGAVGVDVEQVEDTAFAGLGEVALADGESAVTPVERARTWTRKEALSKATGTGLAVDLRSVDVSSSVVARPQPARLFDVPVRPGLACSAAVLGDHPSSLRSEEASLAR